MIDEYISAIARIANHDTIKKHLEPNLMWHENIDKWQVKRILYAVGLFNQEANNERLRKPNTRRIKSLQSQE